MLRFKRICAKGFRLLREADVSFDGQSLVYLGGENLDASHADSNMAGKSTLIHALTWALYGCDAVGNRLADTAITRGQKECDVSAEFVDEDGGVYRVNRSRVKRPRSGNPTVLLGMDTPEAEGRVGPEEQMQDRVDAIFGSKDLFLAAHVFGYEEGMTPFALAPDATQKRLFDLLLGASRFETGLAHAKARAAELSEEIAGKESDLRYETGRLDTLREMRTRQEEDRSRELVALQEELGRTNDALRNTGTEHDRAEKVRTAMGIEEVAAKAVWDELSRKQDEKTAEVEQGLAVARSAIRRLADDRKRIAELAGGVCPTCRGEVPEERAELVVSQIERELRTHEDARGALDAERAALAADKGLKGAERALEAARGRLEEADESLGTATDGQAHARRELEGIRGRIREIAVGRDVAATAEEIGKVEEAVGAMRTRLEILGREQEVTDFWSEGFGPKGIMAYRLDLLTPRLNEVAARYSHAFYGDGSTVVYTTQKRLKSGELRERFEVYLADADGDRIEVLSAGQAQRRDAVHAFTMVELTRALGRRTVDLVVFDEVFRTLDQAGTGSVIRELWKLAGTGGLVLVVEHDDDLRARFPSALTARRSEGATTFEWEE